MPSRERLLVNSTRRVVAILMALGASLATYAQQQLQPKRIVSTSPYITETLFALGLGPRVIAVSEYCRYPAEAAKLPRIGSYLQPNVEVIARLKPDLVLIERLPNQTRPQLSTLSIATAEVEIGNLRRNLDNMRIIGRAAGAAAEADALIKRIEASMELIRQRAKGLATPSLAFVVGRSPGRLDGLIVVGGGSYLSELIAMAGGRNAFGDSSLGYVKTSLETMLRRNPDVIVDMGEMAETVGVTEAQKKAVVSLWGTQKILKSRVFAVASDIYVVPGPRMVDAVRSFAAMLHPELKQ
jgi:iron complex transport system substrate-binding protein